MDDGVAAADDGPLAPRPLTASGLRVLPLSADTVVLKRGVTETRLDFTDAADVLARLVSLADGTTTEDDLVAAFPPEARDGIRGLIGKLRSRGLIHHEPHDDPTTRFWSSVGAHAPGAPDRLASARVLVAGGGPVAEALAGSLRDCGVGSVEPADGTPDGWAHDGHDLWCAAAEGSPELTLIPAARAALAAGVPFLPVWLDDIVVRVGPLTYPFDTACLRCYLLRADANDPQRDVHRLLRAEASAGPASAAYLPSMVGVAGDVAATEAAKHLAGLPVTTAGRAIALSLVPFRAAVHRVLRVPRCAECSGPARQGAPVLTHQSQLRA